MYIHKKHVILLKKLDRTTEKEQKVLTEINIHNFHMCLEYVLITRADMKTESLKAWLSLSSLKAG